MTPLVSLILKDIAVEMRRRESVISMMMFGLLVTVIFNFAFEPSGAERDLLAPGILWVALTFAGVIGLNRSLAIDLDNDCLQGLLLAPVSRGSLYVGKVVSNFLFMIIAELVIVPLFIIFNDLRLGSELIWLILVVVLGTLGFAAVGTILSAISANTRMREVMLPVLQIPLTIPMIIAAVAATGLLLSEDSAGFGAWVNLIIGFDMIFLIVSYLVFEYVVEE
jgi:heme exporter protein B